MSSDITILLNLDICLNVFGNHIYMEEETNKKYIDIIQIAYTLLPIFIGTIHIVKNIDHNIVGMYNKNNIILSSNDIDKNGGLSTLAHETMHYIIGLNKDLFIEWPKLNRFEYIKNWDAYKLRQGYISKYAMSSVDEDICETFSEMITMHHRKTEAFIYDHILLRKMKYLSLLISTININYETIMNDIIKKINLFNYKEYLSQSGTIIPRVLIKDYDGSGDVYWYNKNYIKVSLAGRRDSDGPRTIYPIYIHVDLYYNDKDYIRLDRVYNYKYGHTSYQYMMNEINRGALKSLKSQHPSYKSIKL
jgi:hypothetical protein